MRGRKYFVVIILSWLIILALGYAIVADPRRMESAEIAHIDNLAVRGAELYAQNCIVCHGIDGQGHVGPPLNIAAFKGDPREDTDVYEMLYRTIASGRPGTANPTWYATDDGSWASFTAMPAWDQDAGGTMNEQHLRALAYFIMTGNWSDVSRHVPSENVVRTADGRMDREGTINRLPVGVGISETDSLRGRELFVDRACIGCHAIGGQGQTIGPDLSVIGSWAPNITEEEWGAFLTAWITNPAAVANRAPVYWSNYAGPAGLTDLPEVTEPLPPTQMPALGLTPDETEALVTYLLSLK